MFNTLIHTHSYQLNMAAQECQKVKTQQSVQFRKIVETYHPYPNCYQDSKKL